jgi:hypothetical protein
VHCECGRAACLCEAWWPAGCGSIAQSGWAGLAQNSGAASPIWTDSGAGQLELSMTVPTPLTTHRNSIWTRFSYVLGDPPLEVRSLKSDATARNGVPRQMCARKHTKTHTCSHGCRINETRVPFRLNDSLNRKLTLSEESGNFVLTFRTLPTQ